jgi:hypothetical protein
MRRSFLFDAAVQPLEVRGVRSISEWQAPAISASDLFNH